MNGKKLSATLLLIFSSTIALADCQLLSQKVIGQEILKAVEEEQLKCSGQKIHLTFDDGPNSITTPAIVKELNLRGTKATFFVSTSNLESKHPRSSLNGSIVRDTLNAGHLIASHGHDHHAHDLRLDKEGKPIEKAFSQSEREEQVSQSVELLNQVTGNKFQKQKHVLFRFPYGRGAMPSRQELDQMEREGQVKFSSSDYSRRLDEYRDQSAALQTIAGYGFSHLGWNHDSQDSSGPDNLDKSQLKQYILKNLRSLCHGNSTQVALFHDIKKMNMTAIPVILDVGRCLGLKFISPEEMMNEKRSLGSVLIAKNKIKHAPVDNLGALLDSINKSEQVKRDCAEEVDVVVKDGCFSDYTKKWYRECEGGQSICLGGKWFARQDPTVILNCNITD